MWSSKNITFTLSSILRNYFIGSNPVTNPELHWGGGLLEFLKSMSLSLLMHSKIFHKFPFWGEGLLPFFFSLFHILKFRGKCHFSPSPSWILHSSNPNRIFWFFFCDLCKIRTFIIFSWKITNFELWQCCTWRSEIFCVYFIHFFPYYYISHYKCVSLTEIIRIFVLFMN